MYESHFQFRQRPFLVAPCIERYFPGQAIEHARQTLVRCLERAQGPALLIGSSGTGKSLLCQWLAAYFSDAFAVALLADTKLCTRRALLQNILFELRLPYRDMDEGELRLSLIDFLETNSGSRNGLVLIIDEAHTLPGRLIEEVRMLTNLVRKGEPRIRLLLAGGPQLEERFASPKLESLNQRIAARCYLQSLTREETAAYVQNQISVVGGDPLAVFSESALRSIFSATDGIPRLINQVCDYALLLTSVAGRSIVESTAVEEAWADLQQLPAPWQTSIAKSPLVPTSNIVEFGTLDDAETSPPPASPVFETPAHEAPLHEEMVIEEPVAESFTEENHVEENDRTDDPEIAPEAKPIFAAHEGHRFSPLEDLASPSEQLDKIESQMAEVYADEYPACQFDDFGGIPQGSISGIETEVFSSYDGAPVAPVNTQQNSDNPFGDFAEEEVILDGGNLGSRDWLRNRLMVSCPEGREFAATLKLLEPILPPANESFQQMTKDEQGQAKAMELLLEVGAPFLEEQRDFPHAPGAIHLAKSPVSLGINDAKIESDLQPIISFEAPSHMHVPEVELIELGSDGEFDVAPAFDAASDPVFPESIDTEQSFAEIVEEVSAELDTEVEAEDEIVTDVELENEPPLYVEPEVEVEPEPVVEADVALDLSSQVELAAGPVLLDPSESISTDVSIGEGFVAVASSVGFDWPSAETPVVTAVRVVTQEEGAALPHDDRDILVVEDEPKSRTAVKSSTANPMAGNARRFEYRQLFARLRRR